MSTQGFQILLDAEQQASTVVNEARQYRAQRLKDARREALEDIEAVKQRKNEELMENERLHAGQLQESHASFEEETEKALKDCSQNFHARREEVIEMLLEGVKCCEPHLHPNAELRLRRGALKNETK